MADLNENVEFVYQIVGRLFSQRLIQFCHCLVCLSRNTALLFDLRVSMDCSHECVLVDAPGVNARSILWRCHHIANILL
jgi:hypothetical protein